MKAGKLRALANDVCKQAGKNTRYSMPHRNADE
jgi:hypothetical protein